MSNGVGLLSALSGSIPAPRRTRPADAGSRPPTRAADRAESRKTRTQSPETPARSAARSPAAPAKLPKSRGVVPGERRDPGVPTKTSASRPPAAPLSGSIERLKAGDPSRMRLSLNPAALGEVRIDLVVRGSALRAQVVVETEEARALIEGRLDDLRDLLRKQGFRVGEIRVERASAVEEEARAGGLRSHRRQVLDVRA